ncbi:hypothetical protein V5J35_000067 [Endozoicomonas sp. NE40]|uniref:Uncharacterized protein n=1 Tax=Endozoicomonas lisbonensis TaxID=3120522 RepID=A0ABV2SAV1_9GAMM
MNEMENAWKLLMYSRTFFKGSLKSGNKVFSPSGGSASPGRRQRRNENSVEANDWISVLSNHCTTRELLDILALASPEGRSGNCFEYSMIAIRNGVDLHIPNIWLVIHHTHQFLVLADIASFNDLEAHEFHQFDSNNFWVCDPWFKIHCRMHLYSLMTSIKSLQWECEGKLIFNSDHTELPTLWSQKLCVGKMRFIRMTDSAGTPTNEWWEWYHSPLSHRAT